MNKTVTITLDEAEALAEFLWSSLIPYIKNTDNEVDNLEWVRNLSNVWKKCDDATKGKQGG